MLLTNELHLEKTPETIPWSTPDYIPPTDPNSPIEPSSPIPVPSDPTPQEPPIEVPPSKDKPEIKKVD